MGGLMTDETDVPIAEGLDSWWRTAAGSVVRGSISAAIGAALGENFGAPSGVAFPAVNAVLGRNGGFCVVDGCHRLAASLLAGFGWLPVIVVGETAFYPSVRSDGSWVA